jgi:hypothetical protein
MFQGSRLLTSSHYFTQYRAEAAPTISTAKMPATSTLNQDFSVNPGGAFALLSISCWFPQSSLTQLLIQC